MKVYRSTACVVTILWIFATSSAEGICHHDRGKHNTGFSGEMEGSNNLHCCGNQSYNILKSSCCNGRTIPGNLTRGLSQVVTYCCGSVAYNPLNEICCKDRIFIRTSAHTKCCGKDPYQTKNRICCGDVLLNKQQKKKNCCGKELFDKEANCCCPLDLKIKPKSDPCCQTKAVEIPKSPQCSQASGLEKTTTAPNNITGNGGSYDPQTQICCSGQLYKKSSEFTKCCGKHLYSFSEGNVLCCNGILHLDMPEKSECVGGVVYSPKNTTCHLPVRPNLGEHCCGNQTFDPLIHICCNGHRHYKKNGNFCCGSKVYDHHNSSLRCCSDHLYSTSGGEVECCGNLLLEKNKNQICCSSSTLAIKYVTKSNHHCCGHYYYNTSIWSCCAEHLKPTPECHTPLADYRPKPLMELIPDICNKTVFLGKVESMTLNTSRRHVLLQVVWQVNLKLGNVTKDSWLHVFMDHCSTPVIENGMIYLWEKKGDVYKPLSHPVDLASDIHMFYFLCYQLKDHKNG
ncbi:galaxin isoform X2 [Danio aesculapii]|uniref:galaxin isoform X2 n=2 Tax=Danio aesculapii TaxID=1142201 RepID=UPI0024BF79F3|nr:galaxin isoform X2 [Danio aesculapii]